MIPQRPDDIDKIFVEEDYRVIRPLNSNDIFNKEKYDIKVNLADENGVKMVIIRPKQPPKESNLN